MKKLLVCGVVIVIVAYISTKCCRQKSRDELFTFPETTVWGSSAPSSAVVPFNVVVQQKDVDDLKERLKSWRRHQPLEGVGYSYGLAGAPLDNLVKYWRDKFDSTKMQDRLNSLPQFTTVIQGLRVHFVHVQGDSKAIKRVPLLLVHGWPGSVVEFYRTIPFLTALGKNGLAFDVVAPSIPGYGFSEAANKPGFNQIAAAQVFHTLMMRLGYDRFVYQGGDWGTVIGSLLSKIYPESVIGFHSNMPAVPVASVCDKLHLAAALVAPKLFVDDNGAKKLAKLKFSDVLEESGYLHVQATKPDTLGVGLSDSPVGLAAWIVEKFVNFTERAEFKGDAIGPANGGISNDDILTNVMVYWLSNHATSAGRFYKEAAQSYNYIEEWEKLPYSVPTGVSCYPREIQCSPKSLLKRSMPRLVHYVDTPRGGHFAAFEEPEYFAYDVRTAVAAFLEENDKAQSAKKAGEKLKQKSKVTQDSVKQQKQQEAASTTTKAPKKQQQQQQPPASTTTEAPKRQASTASEDQKRQKKQQQQQTASEVPKKSTQQQKKAAPTVQEAAPKKQPNKEKAKK